MAFKSGQQSGNTAKGSPKAAKPNVMAVRTNSFNPGMPKGTNPRPPKAAVVKSSQPRGVVGGPRGAGTGAPRGTEGPTKPLKGLGTPPRAARVGNKS